MGAVGLTKTRSLQRFFPNFNPMDWQQIPTEQIENQSRFGQFRTFKNISTNQWIDQYELSFYSDKEQKIYQQCFMQRLRQEYLVNAFHYQPLKNPGFCSNIKGAIVYIQHIPIRLCDVTDIPFQQSLYIMKCALYGFQKLFNESGYFQISQEHIGIDKEGHVRVWLNSDLSKNYPFSFDDETHQSKDFQKIMVNEIIKIIQKNTNFFEINQHEQQTKQFTSISTQMQRNNTNHPSFRQAQEIIRQYISKHGIILPKKCNSVIQIIESEYGQNFNISNGSNFSEKLRVADQLNQNSQIGKSSHQSQRIKIESSRNNILQQNSHNPLNILNSNSMLNQNGQQLLAKQKNAVASKYEYQPLFNYIPNDNGETVKKYSGSDSNRSNIDRFRQMRLDSRSSRQLGSFNNNLQGSDFNTNRSDLSSSHKQFPSHNRQEILEPIQSHQMSSKLQSSNASRTNSMPSNINSNSSGQIHSKIPKVTFSYTNKTQQNYQAITNHNNYRQLNLSKIDSNRSQSSLISDLHKNRSQNEKSKNQEKSLDQNNSYNREEINQKQQRQTQRQRQIENYDYDGLNRSLKQVMADMEEEKIDPEIMKDLLKQFPETLERVVQMD